MLDTPAMDGLELFLLRARARQKFLEIRLDQVPLQGPDQGFWGCGYPDTPQSSQQPEVGCQSRSCENVTCGATCC